MVSCLTSSFLDKPGCFESTVDQCKTSPYDCHSNTSGIITSPNYPFPTKGDVDCSWHIVTRETTYIRLRFSHFSTSVIPQLCSDASVKLSEKYQGNKELVIGEYCGEMKPSESSMDSNLNKVIVDLRTSPTNGGLSFMLEYEAVHFQMSLSAVPISPGIGTDHNDVINYYKLPLLLYNSAYSSYSQRHCLKIFPPKTNLRPYMIPVCMTKIVLGS